jgi:hypothetical protein
VASGGGGDSGRTHFNGGPAPRPRDHLESRLETYRTLPLPFLVPHRHRGRSKSCVLAAFYPSEPPQGSVVAVRSSRRQTSTNMPWLSLGLSRSTNMHATFAQVHQVSSTNNHASRDRRASSLPTPERIFVRLHRQALNVLFESCTHGMIQTHSDSWPHVAVWHVALPEIGGMR